MNKLGYRFFVILLLKRCLKSSTLRLTNMSAGLNSVRYVVLPLQAASMFVFLSGRNQASVRLPSRGRRASIILSACNITSDLIFSYVCFLLSSSLKRYFKSATLRLTNISADLNSVRYVSPFASSHHGRVFIRSTMFLSGRHQASVRLPSMGKKGFYYSLCM